MTRWPSQTDHPRYRIISDILNLEPLPSTGIEGETSNPDTTKIKSTGRGKRIDTRFCNIKKHPACVRPTRVSFEFDRSLNLPRTSEHHLQWVPATIRISFNSSKNTHSNHLPCSESINLKSNQFASAPRAPGIPHGNPCQLIATISSDRIINLSISGESCRYRQEIYSCLMRYKIARQTLHSETVRLTIQLRPGEISEKDVTICAQRTISIKIKISKS